MTDSERNAKAKEYIDSIVAINRKYGMGTVVSDEVYEQAVDDAAGAFRNISTQPA